MFYYRKTTGPAFYCDYKTPPERNILLPALLAEKHRDESTTAKCLPLWTDQERPGDRPVPQGHICHGALLPSSVCLRPSTAIAELIQINAHVSRENILFCKMCVYMPSCENSFAVCTNPLSLICKGNFNNKRGKTELARLAATRPPAPAKPNRLHSPGLPGQPEASTVSQSCLLKPLSLMTTALAHCRPVQGHRTI